MANRFTPGVNDLETVNPTLALEWHPTKNGALKPSMVAANDHREVYWLGKCGHTWPARINNRNSHGRGCPYCANQKVLPGFNDLASQYPNLAKQWDSEKNTIAPDEVIAGGNKEYFWLCEKGHSWATSIAKRKRGDGCPYCSNKRLLVGYNDLATTHPRLAREWDYDLNEKSPKEVMAGSNDYAHWKCKLEHTWRAMINARKQGENCPYCAGQKVWPGFNDLETKDPALAAEWDYEKNEKSPSEVTVSSSLPYYWKCQFGHSWQATITNRHQGRGCPECDENNKTSLPEQAIYYYVCRRYPNSVNRCKELFDNGMELDIFIPSLQIGIEYDGPYHKTDEALDRDAKKYVVCQTKGIRLIRVSLRDENPKNPPICDVFIHSEYDYNNYEAIDRVMESINEYIPLSGPFDTKKDLAHIKKGYLNSISKNTLAKKHPGLSQEWNYEKNGGLTPEMFTAGSGEKVWWTCHLGHEWPAVISSRAHGRGCPYCSGQKVWPGFNDLAHLRPDLAAEWDYEKNEGKLPTEVTEHASSSAWWICPKGHKSYRMTIAHRSRGRGCRRCRDEKVGMQFSKQVLQFSLDGTLICEYKSATEASKKMGVSVSAIANACRGKSKTCAGFVFKYKE